MALPASSAASPLSKGSYRKALHATPMRDVVALIFQHNLLGKIEAGRLTHPTLPAPPRVATLSCDPIGSLAMKRIFPGPDRCTGDTVTKDLRGAGSHERAYF